MSHKDPLRGCWHHMRERCNSTGHRQYRTHGGRGIRVCKEWEESFAEFEKWSLANGYEKGLHIGRLDNSKGFTPENCRFGPVSMHAQTRTRCRFETYNGVTANVKELCKMFGKDYNLVRRRLTHGKTIKEAFETERQR